MTLYNDYTLEQYEYLLTEYCGISNDVLSIAYYIEGTTEEALDDINYHFNGLRSFEQLFNELDLTMEDL